MGPRGPPLPQYQPEPSGATLRRPGTCQPSGSHRLLRTGDCAPATTPRRQCGSFNDDADDGDAGPAAPVAGQPNAEHTSTRHAGEPARDATDAAVGHTERCGHDAQASETTGTWAPTRAHIWSTTLTSFAVLIVVLLACAAAGPCRSPGHGSQPWLTAAWVAQKLEWATKSIIPSAIYQRLGRTGTRD